MANNQNKELLIAALIPSFLEKEVSWFTENLEKIRQAAKTQHWWQENILFLEENQKIKISELLRQLIELGYEKTDFPHSPGEFSQRGGFITIWPINEKSTWQIEYLGNRIEKLATSPLPVPEKFLKPKARLGDLERLKPGDYVVHIDHGIGIFRGFASGENLQTSDVPTRNIDMSKYRQWTSEVTGKWFFVIEYAAPKEGKEPDRLLVPLSQAKRLSRYFGFETPSVHRLGTELWIRTKRKIKEGVEKLARELLTLYAKREIVQRQPYPHDPALEKAVSAGFEHIETEDQLSALQDIDKDLESQRPMDRVLVGDVGFGKTEVALRAATKVVLGGKQVAFLAPTTILVHQHFQTFSARLKNFPIEIAMLSRLLSARQIQDTLKKIAEGKVDIVIGTHRLFGKDIVFKNLGLLIVDEEQRFGVKQKEKLKSLRTSLDILSLSATPIPRTLSMALAKLRAMSLIRTPPPGRLAIQTFIAPYTLGLIREAMRLELKRGGQVYFLHNRIETIEMRRKELQKLLPGGKFAIIHGRLPEKALVETMEKFRKGKFDVLVATTIIENGLDLSNVNTLIVADSSRLGLAEAHQLRGRIGRGEARAFAYFLYSPRTLTENVRKRLGVLREASHLGAGYEIAMKDMELRGAGNILGREQSGAINAVGLNLYMQMLSDVIGATRARDNMKSDFL